MKDYKKLPYEVKFSHLRNYDPIARDWGGMTVRRSPGTTVAFATVDDVHYAGLSVTHPNDNFNRALGRTKAAGRLVQAVLGTGQRKTDTELTKWFKSEPEETLEDFRERVSRTITAVMNEAIY